ncbi:hypothetical protein HDU99_001901 [Rhizoclosmatium hyalinum]|nr:hypothetical protein HDU99_001901 [Rhizoclosmatium hyalinum]
MSDDEEALQQQIKALERKLEKKRLQERLAALERELESEEAPAPTRSLSNPSMAAAMTTDNNRSNQSSVADQALERKRKRMRTFMVVSLVTHHQTEEEADGSSRIRYASAAASSPPLSTSSSSSVAFIPASSLPLSIAIAKRQKWEDEPVPVSAFDDNDPLAYLHRLKQHQQALGSIDDAVARTSNFRDRASSLGPHQQTSTPRYSTHDPTIECFSGLRLKLSCLHFLLPSTHILNRNRLVSNQSFETLLTSRLYIPLPNLTSSLTDADIQGDWVTVAVVLSKSAPRMSQNQQHYVVMRLGDLKSNTTVNAFLFGRVFEKWGVSTEKGGIGAGEVIGVLNPKILPVTEKSSVMGIDIDDAGKLLHLGTSMDSVQCKFTSKGNDPKPCFTLIDGTGSTRIGSPTKPKLAPAQRDQGTYLWTDGIQVSTNGSDGRGVNLLAPTEGGVKGVQPLTKEFHFIEVTTAEKQNVSNVFSKDALQRLGFDPTTGKDVVAGGNGGSSGGSSPVKQIAKPIPSKKSVVVAKSVPSLRVDQETIRAYILAVVASRTSVSGSYVRPTPEAMEAALRDLPRTLPSDGLGLEATSKLLLERIAPACIDAKCPTYFGFVTGGVTPAAALADIVVGVLDQNVQVHLPNDSIATTVEILALDMAADLMHIDSRTKFIGKTCTTGATASNILGLACGREAVVSKILKKSGEEYSVADDGLFGACPVVVLHVHGHASIAKAASLLGIGRKNCINMATSPSSCSFDLDELGQALAIYRREGTGVIVVASYGEVNTGRFTSNIPELRALCDSFGCWLHIDAAFGSFAPESTHLHLADSVTSDAHKWLNVPYDCGLFYTHSLDLLQRVCTPSFDLSGGGPAYLAAPPSSFNEINAASPLTVGIENSRRFRALPLYASLVSLGRSGYQDIFTRNIHFAQRIACWIQESREYVLLNGPYKDVSNIVLFAAANEQEGGTAVEFQGSAGNSKLVEAINSTRKMYVTGTSWNSRPAVRLAVSNWQTGSKEGEPDTDFTMVTSILKDLCEAQSKL